MIACDGATITLEPVTFIERRVSRDELPAPTNAGRTLALTDVSLGYVLTTEHGCIVGATVRLYGATVRIDGGLDGCRTRAVRNHEQKHVQAAQAAQRSLALAIERGNDPTVALPRTVAELNATNHAIDSTEEYARLDRECR